VLPHHWTRRSVLCAVLCHLLATDVVIITVCLFLYSFMYSSGAHFFQPRASYHDREASANQISVIAYFASADAVFISDKLQWKVEK